MPAILVHVPSDAPLNGQSESSSLSRMQSDLAATGNSTSPKSLGVTDPDIDSSKMLKRIVASGQRPRVAIIGAGFAGLRAADLLLKKNVDVTIFEARHRVGGRLYQAKVGEHMVDMGPNWIHGTKNNPILDLVRETKTTIHNWGERQVAFAPDGSRIPDNEALKNSEILWELVGDAFEYSNQNSASVPASMSLLDYIREHVGAKVDCHLAKKSEEVTGDTGLKERKDLIVKAAEMWGGFIGGTVSEQSLRFLWLEECLEGENLFCAGTYKNVLDRVAAPVLEANVVRYGEVVQSIHSTQHSNGNALVKIGTKQGTTETFDEVIVTCPLGWLKRNKHVFTPSLPQRIASAIDNLGYGNLDKLYVTFSEAWWDVAVSDSSPRPNGHISSPSQTPQDGDTMPNVTATTMPLHAPSSTAKSENATKEGSENRNSSDIDNDNDKHYAGFTNFIAPEYAPDTNPDHWIQDCINLASMPRDCAHPTLLFYISGPTSTHIASILRSAKSDEEIQQKLWQFVRPYVSKLPNFDVPHSDDATTSSATKSDGDPDVAGAPSSRQPLSILATGWSNDEFAGYGSYTNFPIGIERGDEDVEALRNGEGSVERGVWFAGEHCAPFVALGTVTGAWWAGEGVARRIAAAWDLD